MSTFTNLYNNFVGVFTKNKITLKDLEDARLINQGLEPKKSVFQEVIVYLMEMLKKMIETYNKLYPAEKSQSELSAEEEEAWFNDIKDWCLYDNEQCKCSTTKVLFTEQSVVTNLFDLFNQYLSNKKNNNEIESIIKQYKGIIFSKRININILLSHFNVNEGTYCIQEAAVKDFFTTNLQDTWDAYYVLNGDVCSRHTVLIDGDRFISLDAFAYGLSKYNAYMDVTEIIRNEALIDMHQQPKPKHVEENTHVNTRPLPSNVLHTTNWQQQIDNKNKMYPIQVIRNFSKNWGHIIKSKSLRLCKKNKNSSEECKNPYMVSGGNKTIPATKIKKSTKKSKNTKKVTFKQHSPSQGSKSDKPKRTPKKKVAKQIQ